MFDENTAYTCVARSVSEACVGAEGVGVFQKLYFMIFWKRRFSVVCFICGFLAWVC